MNQINLHEDFQNLGNFAWPLSYRYIFEFGSDILATLDMERVHKTSY